ncbi:MAG: hypothetical protein Athens041674_727 [Parcubacteria group bacterium Athens0416_74]|nr:MAG: hypothetical protein Athens041674_727 [Parcubacteria group bacterium Athens0416_74]
MLKTAQFRNRLRETVGVAYKIFGRSLCVFTNIDDALTQGSSINYAEPIATAIALQENRDIMSMRYFDLQTRGSYGSGIGGKPKPGDYEFDEVVFKKEHDSVVAIAWRPTACPQEVCAIFAMYIDGAPHQVLHRPAQTVSF